MKPQCCAKGQKHQPVFQPVQDSLLEIGTCIAILSIQCIVLSVEVLRYKIYREYRGNTSVCVLVCVCVCVCVCLCIVCIHTYVHR